MEYEVIDGKGIIPDGTTEIAFQAFKGCNSLQSIEIPDSVTQIGDEAFSGCGSLQSIVIPDSVTEIGRWAFAHCTSLQSIEIPDSVTQIDGSVFCRCNNLTSIIVSKNNSRYKSTNNCILTKDGKKLVLCRNHNIPDNVTMIERWAFSGCTSLQSIEIPNIVTEIGEDAFRCCTSLQSIVIPDSVTKIGESAFSGCISLQSIDIVTQEKEPDLSLERIEYLLQALSEYSKEFSLRVPISCDDAYRHYPAFEGKFKTIIADIDA